MAAFLVFSCLLFAERSLQATSPFGFTWSDNTYGPDGPWYAVTVQLGSDSQSVDLYPGDTYASVILSSDLCSNKSLGSTCYAEKAGTYTQNTSSSAMTVMEDSWGPLLWNAGGKFEARHVLDTMTLSNQLNVWEKNISLDVTDGADMTYPGNMSYQPNVGFLSLGAPSEYRWFGDYQGWYITSALYEDSVIPSAGYGMHIGSAATNPPIEPSLYLGGFDKGRVLNNVSSQQANAGSGSQHAGLLIRLNDIAIGVEEGGWPFSFRNKTNTGLLQTSGSQLPQVELKATNPYMYLPTATCEAIAAYLPVHYNASLGLYIWNTSNPDFKKIVKSPGYLSFNFEKDGDNNNQLEIKLPFALLNLTLEAPLVDKPTSYLPFTRYDGDEPLLGRAFLQAAFIGVNWGTGNSNGNWFLAQAPGPELPSVSTEPMSPGTTAITGSKNSWKNTWSSHWTPVPDGSSHSGGLSSGAKTGIGVGVGVGGAALIFLGAAAFFFYRKRAARQDVAAQPQTTTTMPAVAYMPQGAYVQQPGELDAGREAIAPVEKSADTQPLQRHELA